MKPSPTWTWGSIAAIAVLVVLHYSTHGGHGGDAVWTHALYRRLAYLPIGVLAVAHGLRGGLLAGAAVALLYVPHAFFAEPLGDLLGVHLHADPSPPVEKLSEIVLYLGLGALVGSAVEAARRSRRALGAVQRDLEQTEADLRRAERLGALGELTAGIAHEVRNPLTSLRATGEMLAEAYPEGHRRHRMARLHLEEIDRLEAVVQKFLDFARPKPLTTEERPAAEILQSAADLLRATARQADVVVEVEPPEGPLALEADGDLLVQVLLNLGLNAVQVSPPGARVMLGAERGDGCVRFYVDDEGPGVDPALSERVFDPCVTTRAEGSGLGLSVASRIVEAHQGRLTFAPRDEGGTRFELCLPRVTA